MSRPDATTGAILAGVGLILLFLVVPNHVGGMAGGSNVKPELMPKLASATLLVLGLMLFVGSWFRAAATGPNFRGVLAPIAAMAVVIASLFVWVSLGYWAAAPLLLVALQLLCGARGPIAILATAICVPGTVWLLARFALKAIL